MYLNDKIPPPYIFTESGSFMFTWTSLLKFVKNFDYIEILSEVPFEYV